MLRVGGEDLLGDRRRQGLPTVAGIAGPHAAEQRQRIEGADLVVVGILRIQPRHRVRVGDVARQFVARAEVEHLHRLEQRLLLRQLGLGQPRLVRRRELVERGLRLGDVLLRPQRMVVAHGLAPVGHGEVRVDLLGLLERQGRLVELEVVQGLHSGEKGLLRRGRARGGESDRSELLGGRSRRQRKHPRDHERRRRANTNHGCPPDWLYRLAPATGCRRPSASLHPPRRTALDAEQVIASVPTS